MDKHFTLEGNIAHFTIADIAAESNEYRRVLWTGEHSQLVIMNIPPGEEIGEEVHEDGDQILTFISGTGHADLAGHQHPVEAGDQCVVPSGTLHNFRNTGEEPLVLYTVYSPPEHPAGTVQATKSS